MVNFYFSCIVFTIINRKKPNQMKQFQMSPSPERVNKEKHNSFLLKNIWILLVMMISLNGYSQADKIFYEVASGEWELSDQHSSFEFEISNLWLINTDGSMDGVEGALTIGNSLNGTSISLTLDAKTINTGNNKRDDHLRSEDFFYVEKYPHIKFTSENIASHSGDYPYVANGTLTMRDESKKIAVPFRFSGMKTIDGKSALVFEGETTLNRRDFNVDYSGPGLGDEVTVTFSLVAVK